MSQAPLISGGLCPRQPCQWTGVGTGRVHNGCAQLALRCAPATHLGPGREDSWDREAGGAGGSGLGSVGLESLCPGTRSREGAFGLQTTFLWFTFSGGRQLTAGLWGPLGSAVPGDSGPPAARRVRANTTSVFRFQSGKLVTKMFQKIQDLIDDKDALVFVLIDEVGVCGRRTRACGGSSPDRPLPLLGHGPPPAQPTVSHGPVSGIPHTERARVGGAHPPVCLLTRSIGVPCPLEPGVALSALRPHRWRASRPPATPAGRAPSLQTPSAWSMPS